LLLLRVTAVHSDVVWKTFLTITIRKLSFNFYEGLCESNVDSEKLYSSSIVHMIKALYSLYNHSPLKAKRQIKRISPTVFHKKEYLKRYKHLVLRFWLTAYLLCLVGVLSNSQYSYGY